MPVQTDAFVQCAMELQRTLYRVAKTLLRSDQDCADAVQEAMLKGIAGAGRLREEKFVKTWLTRILINTCKDMLRKQSRVQTVELLEDYPAPPINPQAALYEALSSLDEALRLPMVLYYLEGFTVKEVSDMIAVPEGTVKRRLWNARKEMREILKEEAI